MKMCKIYPHNIERKENKFILSGQRRKHFYRNAVAMNVDLLLRGSINNLECSGIVSYHLYNRPNTDWRVYL